MLCRVLYFIGAVCVGEALYVAMREKECGTRTEQLACDLLGTEADTVLLHLIAAHFEEVFVGAEAAQEDEEEES